MKIDLPLWDRSVSAWGPVVEAELVDVAPHLWGTFAVHRDPLGDMFRWKVTHVETGSFVSNVRWIDSQTKRDCIKAVRKFLATVTPETMDARMRELRRHPCTR
jgi:hypothetical protein